MRILIISYAFAPFNSIGSVRVTKTVKYLEKLGYEIKVLTADDLLLPKTLPVETNQDNILRVAKKNLALLTYNKSLKEKVIQHGYEGYDFLKYWYNALFHFPDGERNWVKPAYQKALPLIQEWRPDVIYASAHPLSVLVLGYKLHKKFGIPWIAELRDLWTDNPYYNYPKVRKWIEHFLERKILSTTKGLVTVSEPLADILGQKFGIPTKVVVNGHDVVTIDKTLYDRVYFPNKEDLNIVYTGMIYKGKRDPSVLFEAIKTMKPEDRARVKVHFYGRYLSSVSDIVKNFGVMDNVILHEPLPYNEALHIQQQADVLLLLLWNDPKEKGVYSGKLFEYIGAQRPILALGYEEGVAAQLIKNRDLGFIKNDVSFVKKKLEEWLFQKQGNPILPFHSKPSADLSRESQTKQLSNFIEHLL